MLVVWSRRKKERKNRLFTFVGQELHMASRRELCLKEKIDLIKEKGAWIINSAIDFRSRSERLGVGQRMDVDLFIPHSLKM
jgi:hypothetical protein